MNLPLKFCVSCGRAFTSKESSKMGGLKQIIRAGITKKLEDTPTPSTFGRARRSYGFEKALRQFSLTGSYIFITIVLYLAVMSYCMKDPKVAAMVHGLFSRPTPQAGQHRAQYQKTAGVQRETGTAKTEQEVTAAKKKEQPPDGKKRNHK